MLPSRSLAGPSVVTAAVAVRALHRPLVALLDARGNPLLSLTAPPPRDRRRHRPVVLKKDGVNRGERANVRRAEGIQPAFGDDELLRICFDQQRGSTQMSARDAELLEEAAAAFHRRQVHPSESPRLCQALHTEHRPRVPPNTDGPPILEGSRQHLVNLLRKPVVRHLGVLVPPPFKKIIESVSPKTKIKRSIFSLKLCSRHF